MALLFVAAAVLVHWALGEVLSPVPGLVFYLAWVGAAAFGGLGPGLLAVLASWWCMGVLLNSPPWQAGFGEPASIARILIFLGGGLVVSVAGEKMRRSRIRARRQGRELADLNTALRVSEEKYRFLVENSKDITGTIDLRGQPTFVSANVEKLTGYRPDEFIGKTLWDFLAPECHDLVKENLRRHLRGEDVPPYEVLVVGKDGRRIPFEVVMASIVDDGGNIVGTQGVLRDITERKRAEEVLRASEEKYRFLVENSKDITWTSDLQGRLTFISGNLEKVTGYRADELIGKTLWDFLTPESRDLVQEKLRRRVGREDLPPYELVFVGKDGRHIPFEVLAASILDAGGNTVGVHGVSRDITERKRVEEALRESEFHLAQAQQITHLGSWSWDFAEDRLFWSDETYRLYGLQPGESVPRHEDFLRFVHPEDRPRVEQCVQEALAHGGSSRLDFRIVQKGGQERYVSCEAQVVLDREGHPVKAEGALQDITERKRAEEAVAESRKKYRGLVEKVNDWVWEIDADGVYTYSSPRALDLLGYAPEEIVGKTPFDLMPPAEARRVWNAFQPIWLERKPLERLENTLVRKDGRLVTVETSGMPVFAEDGAFLGYTGVDRDVTARKQAEEALRESEERFRKVFEEGPIGMVLTSRDFGFFRANPAFCRMLGYTPEEMSGLTFLDVTHPEHRAADRDNVERLWQGEIPVYRTEKRYIAKNGDIRWGNLSASLIQDHEGRPLYALAIAEDITERKQAEQDLRESRDRYQALIETMADFIWETDASGRYTYCSPQMKALWGYEPQDMIGKTPFDVMPPEEGKQARASFTALAQSPQPFTGLEAPSYDSQGRLITVEISGVPFFDADGRWLGYRGISRDVTARKRAEEALREHQQMISAIVESSHDWVWTLDLMGRHTYSNQAVEAILGYSAAEFQGMGLDLVHPEDRRIVEARWPSWVEARQGWRNLVLRWRAKDGSYRYLESTAVPLLGSQSELLGFCGVDRDITERKQAEEALRESEEKFRLLAETLPAAILIYQDGKYVYVNPAAESLTGYRHAELLPQAPGDIVHPDYRRQVKQMVSRRTHGEGPPMHYELKILTKDGQERWMDSVTASITYGNRPAGLVVAFDVTERKRAEEALRQSEEKYKRLIETTNTGYVIIDAQGCVVDANAEYARLTGRGRVEDVVGHSVLEWTSPDDVERNAAKVRECVERGLVRNLEVDYLTPTGQLIPVEINATVLRAGGSNQILSLIRDITERKGAEEALRKSEEKFAKAFRSSPIAIAVTCLSDGRIIDANEAMLKLLHFTADEVVGHTTLDLGIWVDVNDRVQFMQLLATAGSVRDLEYRLRTKDGQIVTIHLSAEVLEFGGEPCLLATLVDVTERQRAVDALRQEKAFTDKLLNAPRDTVFLFEPATGKPIRWNKRFAEVSGYDDEEIARMKAPDDFYDENDLKKAREAAVKIAAEGQGVVELSLITRQGVHIPFEYAATVVEAENEETLLLSIGRDITERKRAEEALQELNATLESRVAQRTAQLQDRARQLQKLTQELTEAEERERKRLAEILHDDLQQVLAAAKFQVGLLSSRVKKDAESEEIAGHARNLLVEAIAKSRSLSHELSAPVLSQCDLCEAFRWLAEQMQKKHGFTAHLEMDERIELASEPLRVLLYKAAQELLFNVIKHAGVQEATLRLRRQRGRLRVGVADRGRGFNPTDPGAALGFGLLSIRERVGCLGGRLKIHSKPGKGSIFLISVPDAEVRVGE